VLSTPLHHKPIVYGSPAADWAFWTLVALHVLAACVAPVAAAVAFATIKGGRVHLASGRWFARSMLALATTGIAIDLVRLCSHVQENHTKYAGFGMPSSFPARLGFLYAAFCVLYLLRESTPPRGLRPGASSGSLPAILIAAAAVLVAVVVARYNPWTGALWMIVTLAPAVLWTARAPRADRRSAAVRHGATMAVLAGFAWWGALQGFGPAIAIALRGDDPSTQPYVGNLPGHFSPFFFLFFVGWAPPFALGVALARRIARRRAATAG
jgi:hypothetical protein